MPVYNGEKYLREAINSILSQTFRDFKFLIINDGSTDNSENIIKSYNDSRIKYLKNTENLGIVETLNFGISQINTKYIARMDCDDVSLPTRIEKQISFMDDHKKIAISGTWIYYIGKNMEIHYPSMVNSIKSEMLLGSQIAHPTVIMRKSELDKNNIKYSQKYKYANDYELWIKTLIKGLNISNIPEILLYYRIHPLQMSQTYTNRDKETLEIQKEYFLFLLHTFKFLNPIYLISIVKYIKYYFAIKCPNIYLLIKKYIFLKKIDLKKINKNG